MELKSRFQRYFIRKYDLLLKKAESHWNQHFGGYSTEYAFFKRGLSKTFTDLKHYCRLTLSLAVKDTISTSTSPCDLSRNDLRVMRTVPRDMVRLMPLLACVALPGTVAVLPLFYAFPHVFLTRAFWKADLQRRIDEKELQKRLLAPNADLIQRLSMLSHPNQSRKHWRIHRVKRNVPVVESSAYDRKLLATVLESLGRNELPPEEDLKGLIAIFDGPLNLNALDHHHVTFLCGLHGLVWYRKPRHSSMVHRRPILNPVLSPVMLSSRVNKLESRARIIYAEDRDIAECLRKGHSGVPLDELKELCLVRGINCYILEPSEMVLTLRGWTELSLNASDTSHSYRLHLPFLCNYKRYLRRW